MATFLHFIANVAIGAAFVIGFALFISLMIQSDLARMNRRD